MAYKDVLRNAIRTLEDLEKWLAGRKAKVDPRLKDVIAKYPMRVNSYYLSLIEKMNDGIWKLNDPIEKVEGKRKRVNSAGRPKDEGEVPV